MAAKFRRDVRDRYPGPPADEHRSAQKQTEARSADLGFMPTPGLEPGTLAFSMRCSTN